MKEPTAATWNSRPLFVSSTFADMHDERDYLRIHAFDVLAEQLKERRHYLEVIDLRQGLETADESDEIERELKVLRVCLDEIERSRPFFIGIIGDRYGWDPPEERMVAAAEAAGFPCDVTGKKSVTELEILYGVLENPDQRKRSWFYLREMDYVGMPDEVRRLYDDRFAGDTEKADKLDKLKDRLKKELPDHVRTYQARWNPDLEKVVDLDNLAKEVRDDLWTAVDKETQEWLRDAPDTWQEADARLLDDFVLDRLRIVDGEIKGFVERRDVTNPLIEHALSPTAEGADWGICLTGEAGSGKSSLFARIFRDLQEKRRAGGDDKDIFLLAHAAGIYPGSGSVDTLLRRWIHELAGFLQIDDPLEAEEEKAGADSGSFPSLDNPLERSTTQSPAEEVENTFASLLGRASLKARVVVLIDALNQFDRSTRARYLTWLPKLWPENARFIATAIPDIESETLAGKDGFEVKALEKMSPKEAGQVARQFYKERFHREPNARALDVLLRKTLRDAETLACSNPLWLELALQEMNLLEADDYKRAEEDFPTLDGAKRIEALQMREAENLPPDPAGVYGELLARAERDFGKEWTRGVVNAIALSRAGWRESDLKDEAWDELAFAGVRRTLGPHMVQRGAHAQWDFFHAQLRECVLERNLPDDEERKMLHGLIADHLEDLPKDDPLRVSETMVHLIGFRDRTRAARYFGNLDHETPALLNAATVLAQDAAEDTKSLKFMAMLPLANDLSNEDVWRTATSLHTVGLKALKRVAGLGQSLTLLRSCHAALENLTSSNPLNLDWQHGLNVILAGIGDVLVELGDLDDALSAYHQSMEATELSMQGKSPNAVWQHHLNVTRNRIADILVEQGNLGEALATYRQSLEIAKLLSQSDLPNSVWQNDISVSQSRIGDILFEQESMDDALSFYRQSLEMAGYLA